MVVFKRKAITENNIYMVFELDMLLLKATIIHEIFETSSSFHVK